MTRAASNWWCLFVWQTIMQLKWWQTARSLTVPLSRSLSAKSSVGRFMGTFWVSLTYQLSCAWEETKRHWTTCRKCSLMIQSRILWRTGIYRLTWGLFLWEFSCTCIWIESLLRLSKFLSKPASGMRFRTSSRSSIQTQVTSFTQSYSLNCPCLLLFSSSKGSSRTTYLRRRASSRCSKWVRTWWLMRSSKSSSSCSTTVSMPVLESWEKSHLPW